MSCKEVISGLGLSFDVMTVSSQRSRDGYMGPAGNFTLPNAIAMYNISKDTTSPSSSRSPRNSISTIQRSSISP